MSFFSHSTAHFLRLRTPHLAFASRRWQTGTAAPTRFLLTQAPVCRRATRAEYVPVKAILFLRRTFATRPEAPRFRRREDVYRARNRSLLMYATAVVCQRAFI